MLGAKLFLVLYLVYVADAQYRRLPLQRPLRSWKPKIVEDEADSDILNKFSEKPMKPSGRVLGHKIPISVSYNPSTDNMEVTTPPEFLIVYPEAQPNEPISAESLSQQSGDSEPLLNDLDITSESVEDIVKAIKEPILRGRSLFSDYPSANSQVSEIPDPETAPESESTSELNAETEPQPEKEQSVLEDTSDSPIFQSRLSPEAQPDSNLESEQELKGETDPELTPGTVQSLEPTLESEPKATSEIETVSEPETSTLQEKSEVPVFQSRTSDSEPIAESEIQSEAKLEPEPESVSNLESESKDESKPKPEPEAESKPDTMAMPDSDPELGPDPKPGPESEPPIFQSRSSTDPEPETALEAEPVPNTEPVPELETKPESESETAAESEPTPEPQPESDPKPESKSEAEPSAPIFQSRSSSDTEPEPALEAEPVSDTKPELETKPESESETAVEPESEPKPESQSESEPKSEPESEPKPESGSILEPEPEIKDSPPVFQSRSSSDPEPEPALDADLGPEPATEPEAESEHKLESKPEPEPKPGLDAESEPEAASEPTTEPTVAPTELLTSEGNPEFQSRSSSDTEKESEPVPESDPKSETETKPTDEAEPEPVTETEQESKREKLESEIEPKTTPEPDVPIFRPRSPSFEIELPTFPMVDGVCVEEYGYYEIPNECDTFIECKQHIAEKYICPDGLLFNPKTPWPHYPCGYPTEVECGNKVIKQLPSPVGLCPHRFGTFPYNSDDCGKYVVCEDGQALIMNCPAGLVFNPTVTACDWPENVPYCKLKVFEDFTCPEQLKEYGTLSEKVFKYRYKNSCNDYIACVKGLPRLLRCDSGLSFDDASGRCIASKKVTNCEGNDYFKEIASFILHSF